MLATWHVKVPRSAQSEQPRNTNSPWSNRVDKWHRMRIQLTEPDRWNFSGKSRSSSLELCNSHDRLKKPNTAQTLLRRGPPLLHSQVCVSSSLFSFTTNTHGTHSWQDHLPGLWQSWSSSLLGPKFVDTNLFWIRHFQLKDSQLSCRKTHNGPSDFLHPTNVRH